MHIDWRSAVPAQTGPQDDMATAQSATLATVVDSPRTLELGTVRAIGAEPRAVPLGFRARISTRLKVAIVACDVAAVILGLVTATVLYAVLLDGPRISMVPLAIASVPIWPLMFAQQGLYQSRRLGRRMEEVRLILNSTVTSVIVVAGLSVLVHQPLPRGWLGIVFVVITAAVIIEREVVRRSIEHLRIGGFISRRVVVVGVNSEAEEVAAMLRATPTLGYQVVGFVAEPSVGETISFPSGQNLGPYLGRPDQVLDLVRATRATGVVVATTGVNKDRANQLVRSLTREGLYVEMTSGIRDICTSRMTMRSLGGFPVVCVEPVAGSSWRTIAKRFFDVVTASVLIALASPLLIGATLAVRVTSGRGVLFRQPRVGRNGQLFTVYKFRTMVVDAEDRLEELRHHNEAAGPMFKMSDDPRVTPIGKFLRASSIDELPQLFNVVKGDMSLVGPRPALPSEAMQWDDNLRERLRVQPGITGMWQVSGRFTASIEAYARLDLYYVDNWSLVTDLAILAKTLPAVLKRDGAV